MKVSISQGYKQLNNIGKSLKSDPYFHVFLTRLTFPANGVKLKKVWSEFTWTQKFFYYLRRVFFGFVYPIPFVQRWVNPRAQWFIAQRTEPKSDQLQKMVKNL